MQLDGKKTGMDTGLGWWLNPKDKIFWHGGNTNGFATSLAFTKEKEFAVVILANVGEHKEREPLTNSIILDLLKE